MISSDVLSEAGCDRNLPHNLERSRLPEAQSNYPSTSCCGDDLRFLLLLSCLSKPESAESEILPNRDSSAIGLLVDDTALRLLLLSGDDMVLSVLWLSKEHVGTPAVCSALLPA